MKKHIIELLILLLILSCQIDTKDDKNENYLYSIPETDFDAYRGLSLKERKSKLNKLIFKQKMSYEDAIKLAKKEDINLTHVLIEIEGTDITGSIALYKSYNTQKDIIENEIKINCNKIIKFYEKQIEKSN